MHLNKILPALVVGLSIAMPVSSFAAQAEKDAAAAPAAENAAPGSPDQAQAKDQAPSLAERAEKVPALAGFLNKGATVKSTFTVGDNLRGWMLHFAGTDDIYYTSRDGNFLLLGALMDADGNNVSAKVKAAMNESAPDKDKTAVVRATDSWKKGVYKGLEGAKSLTIGDKGPNLYVFYEPTCPFCAKLHQRLGMHQVKAHYIMVDFLSSQSEKLAETLWTLPKAKLQPAFNALVMSNLAGTPHEGHGSWIQKYAPKVPLKNAGQLSKDLNHNKALMQQARVNGTPAIVYKDKQGQVHIQHGLPSNSQIEAILASAT